MNLIDFLNKDIDFILSKIDFAYPLKGCSVLVTGATGLIGSNFIRLLMKLNNERKMSIKIIALVRNKNKLNSMFPDNNFVIIESNMSDEISYEGSVDYIVHAASPTQSKYLVSNPVNVIEDTVVGALNIIKFAREKQTKSLVYLSSIEVYGQIFDRNFVSEEDYGYIDVLNPRSCYSEGKRIIECLFMSAYSQYNVPVKIARLTQTIGPGVDFADNRVFCQFARCVIDSKNIILHTEGLSSKTYVYTLDALHAILRILLLGANGKAYNVSNDDTYTSIRELAEYVKNEFNPIIDVVYDISDNSCYAPNTKVRLNTNSLKGLGWQAYYDLKAMFSNLIKYFELANTKE